MFLPINITKKIFDRGSYLYPFAALCFTSLLLLFVFCFRADAIGISPTAVTVPLTEGSNGDIVSFKGGRYLLSSEPFDTGILGVVVDSAAVVIEDRNLKQSKLVATSGEVYVRVTSANGNIVRGDYITSSTRPGIGQLANSSGQVLGVALEDYNSDNPENVGDILVLMDINSVLLSDSLRVNLLQLLKSGFKVPFLTPLTSLRYILAAIIVLVSFFIGFVSFSKLSSNSVVALGRNPLAQNIIKKTVLFNFFFTSLIIICGVILAYFILSL